MEQTWRTVHTRPIIKDRWIDLRADHCVTPGGTDIDPYYVLTYADWVHVVALTADDSLVLVRQYRHAVNAVILELPAGVIDPSDSSPEQAARRELREETGYIAAEWRLVSSLFPNPATHTNRVHVYLALGAARDQAQQLDAGEEGLQVAVVPVSDIIAGLHDGVLAQSLHVAGLLMALSLVGRLQVRPSGTAA